MNPGYLDKLVACYWKYIKTTRWEFNNIFSL